MDESKLLQRAFSEQDSLRRELVAEADSWVTSDDESKVECGRKVLSILFVDA